MTFAPACYTPINELSTRQKKRRKHLAATRFDALLISHLANIRYLCGFTGSAGFLLVQHTQVNTSNQELIFFITPRIIQT